MTVRQIKIRYELVSPKQLILTEVIQLEPNNIAHKRVLVSQ